MSDAPGEGVTLARVLGRASGPHAAGVAALVGAIADAGVAVARELARAPLLGATGLTGTVNVQGEAVKKLDLWANDAVLDTLAATGRTCLLVSEEMAEPLHLPDACRTAGYVVCFDPVDGSSNLDVNGTVGTIFSIRARTAVGADHAARDAVLPGTAQLAAGYVMYGPATQLVMTAGETVDAFTLDRGAGVFRLTHSGVRIPPRGRTYSVNEGNSFRWPPDVVRYVRYLKEEDVATGRPYAARYAGSLVADFHRTLLEGGIFMYPADATAKGKPTGKLRLQYEAAPVGLLAERAGGRASTGTTRILDVVPASPHQRVPLIVGSPEDVSLAEDFYAQRR